MSLKTGNCRMNENGVQHTLMIGNVGTNAVVGATQSAPLLREKSVSDSFNRCAFLVIPRRAVRFVRPHFFLLIISSTFAQTSSEPGTPIFNGQSWWNYVKVLAGDNMEGRNTGSEGLKRAEAYIVEQLKADRLQPAGTDGYYQPVKLISRRTLETDWHC